MGVWGTGLSSSDIFKDVYDEFFGQYNQGVSIPAISQALAQTYASVLRDSDEANEFYFALAKAQWECGVLDKTVFQRVKVIVESGSELKRWQSLGASAKDIQKREKVILQFLDQLRNTNTKPRKPKPIKLVDAIFDQGNCLAIPLGDGQYGAALVLSGETQTEYGLNLILAVDFMSATQPTVRDIAQGRCLNRHLQSMPPKPHLQYCYAKHYKRSESKPEKIAQIQFKQAILPKNTMPSYGRWDSLAETIQYEKTHNSNESDALRVSKFMKKSLFW